MDIKKSILELLKSEYNIRYSYIAIEKIILTVFEDYLKKQDKEIIFPRNINHRINFDAILPEGFDTISGKVGVELKIYRNNTQIIRIYDIIGRILVNSDNIDALLLVLVTEVSECTKQKIYRETAHLNFKILIWDINDVVDMCRKNESFFFETYTNINNILLNDTVTTGLHRDSANYKKKRDEYVNQLSQEYSRDNIVLFLGAGASFDAGISTWDNLISKLFVALLEEKFRGNGVNISFDKKDRIVENLMEQNSGSQLLQTRFIRSGFENRFTDIVSDILYENSHSTSSLINEICQLCISKRGKIGVQAVINYNFDDLIERNLERLRVKYRSIYAEGMIPDNEEVGIYHVHGFLPKDKQIYKDLEKSLLVFSEEGYHKLFLEPYNWANMIQLNYLINNTCIFIGLSMTDPNLRRLLEISAQKSVDIEKRAKHYAILKRMEFKENENFGRDDKIVKFEKIYEVLQESLFAELGLNIIWIDNFSEIPNLLKKIKENKFFNGE